MTPASIIVSTKFYQSVDGEERNAYPSKIQPMWLSGVFDYSNAPYKFRPLSDFKGSFLEDHIQKGIERIMNGPDKNAVAGVGVAAYWATQVQDVMLPTSVKNRPVSKVPTDMLHVFGDELAPATRIPLEALSRTHMLENMLFTGDGDTLSNYAKSLADLRIFVRGKLPFQLNGVMDAYFAEMARL